MELTRSEVVDWDKDIAYSLTFEVVTNNGTFQKVIEVAKEVVTGRGNALLKYCVETVYKQFEEGGDINE